MSVARILGMALAILGVLATVFPDGFGSLTGEPAVGVHEAVERRVRGGMVLGAVSYTHLTLPTKRIV